jgi:hypothetical protein
MTADEYLKQRLDEQIKVVRRQEWVQQMDAHHNSRKIVCAAIIPLLSGFTKYSDPLIVVIMGVLGVCVAVAAGFSSLLKYQENWIKYRTTAESLKKEKHLFQTRVEPYNTEEPLGIFVQRVETLVSQENTNWAQYMMRPVREGNHHA